MSCLIFLTSLFCPYSYLQAEADCTQAINLDKKVTFFPQNTCWCNCLVLCWGLISISELLLLAIQKWFVPSVVFTLLLIVVVCFYVSDWYIRIDIT